MVKNTLLFILAVLFFSCQEEDRFDRDYPVVITKSVSEITEEGATFNGALGESNLEDIVEYGFVWGKGDDLSLETNFWKSIGTVQTQNFSTRIKSTLALDFTYYVRTYVKTESKIVYGNLVSFRAKGSSEPILDVFAISPSELKECDTLKITWKNEFIKSIDNLEINDINYQNYVMQDNMIKVVPILPALTFKVKIDAKGFSAQKEFSAINIKPNLISTFPTSFGPSDTLDIVFDYLPECRVVAYTSSGYFSYTIEGDKLRLYFTGEHYCTTPNDFTIKVQTATLFVESPLITKKPNGWSNKDYPPVGGFSGGFSFSIGNKGYRGYYGYNLWEYEPATDQWTQKGIVPDVSWNAGAFVINGKAYVGVGGGSTGLWEYDPTTDTWLQMSSFPGELRFQNAIFFSINGKGYVGGGQDANYTWLMDFWEFDPEANQWSRKADLLENSGFYPKCFSFNNLGYYITLRQGDSDFFESYFYDPVNDQWGKGDNLIHPLNNPNLTVSGYTIGSVFVLDEIVYLVIDRNTYKIDLPSNRLTLVSCSPSRGDNFYFVINGKGYMGRFGLGEAVFEFDPSKL